MNITLFRVFKALYKADKSHQWPHILFGPDKDCLRKELLWWRISASSFYCFTASMSFFCSPTAHLSQPERHRLCHVSRYPRGKTKQDLPFPVYPPIFWREEKQQSPCSFVPPRMSVLECGCGPRLIPASTSDHSVTTVSSKACALISEGRAYEVQLPWAAETQMILWFSTEAACWHHPLTIIMLLLKKKKQNFEFA